MFGKTNSLHVLLQSVEINLEEAYDFAETTILELVEMKQDEFYDQLKKEVLECADQYLIEPPSSSYRRGRRSGQKNKIKQQNVAVVQVNKIKKTQSTAALKS